MYSVVSTVWRSFEVPSYMISEEELSELYPMLCCENAWYGARTACAERGVIAL